MDWISWYIVLGLTLTSRAFECPEGPGCSHCESRSTGVYEIDCTTSSDAVFKVSIHPDKYLQLFCPNSANFTEFYLGLSHPVKGIKSLYFEQCNLSEGDRLGAIARQLGADDVETLAFRSHKNLSSTLTKESLRGFTHLQQLTLTDNALSELPEDLLDDFVNLTLLNLLGNNLRILPEKFFSVSNLEVVELGINKIESLASTTFEKLRLVHLLNIWNNKLVKILPHTFDNLISLKTLSIHRNYLETLPSDIFARLENLKIINLSQNNFTVNTLPADLFRNNSNLERVTLFENKRNMTSLPNGLFANLTKLGEVKMHKNGFTSLPEDLFRGAINLKNVSFARNLLSTLPSQIFKETYELYILNLSFNDISYLPDDVFASLGKLVNLDLSKNHLTTISDKIFSSLLSLRELNMEHNNIVNIDINAFSFLQNLRIANFAYNSLTLLTPLGTSPEVYLPESPFHACQELEKLYLMNNNITHIFDDWLHSMGLRVLNLSKNRLRLLRDMDLNFVSKNLNVDLTHNNISRIEMPTVELWALSRSEPRNVIIWIENNPIRCDCKLYDLLRYREGRMHPNVQNAFHLEIGKLTCQGPHDFRDIAIADLKSETLQCHANGPEFKNLSCPDKCQCYQRPENKAFLVNCAHKGLTEAPPKLESPPDYHIELNLTGNFITKMPILGQSGYDKVTILTLDHNRISSLSINEISHHLVVLQLNNNNLMRLSQNVINLFKNASSLKELTLQANPWKCDCNAQDFLNFIQSKRTQISDWRKVTCVGKDKPISEMTPGEICPEDIGWIIGSCLGVAFLGIIVGSLAALYYRYQREVKVWLYARQWCLWLVTEDELDKDKLYDAFISYSHKDENFVVNDLVPKLEEGPRPFKLCIHFRDWLAGEWIPKQIARSVEESRRTIVVLSPNFLESVWGRMEFRAAHSQALSEGRARVIVILYGDIGPTDDLDPELKAYLSMNTYVKWGDPWFWEKLNYALPHPPEFTKGNMRRKIFETTQPRIHIQNDKCELINVPGVPATPPAATTPPADAVKTFIPNDVTHNELDKPQVKDLNILNAGTLPIVITNRDPKKNSIKVNKVQCTTV